MAAMPRKPSLPSTLRSRPMTRSALHQGHGIREIARELHMGGNTVR